MGSIGKPFCHLADRAYTALSQFKVIISSRSKKCHGIMTNRAYSVYAIAKLGYFSSLLFWKSLNSPYWWCRFSIIGLCSIISWGFQKIEAWRCTLQPLGPYRKLLISVCFYFILSLPPWASAGMFSGGAKYFLGWGKILNSWHRDWRKCWK